MAKELLGVKETGAPPSVVTKESDIWSFGMTIMVANHPLLVFSSQSLILLLSKSQEILTDDIPFSDMINEAQVILAVVPGRLPEPPADLQRRRRVE